MRRSKYGAIPTVVEGIRFHSKREARRWQELRLLERAGEIRNLRRQVPFELHALPWEFSKRTAIILDRAEAPIVGRFLADFTYEECPRGLRWTGVVEDAKGVRTAMYRWKAKHMKAQYGIEIREV